MLAGDYARRIALARAAGGRDLAAVIDALEREQHAAESALRARLMAEAKAQRGSAAPLRSGLAVAFRWAGREVAHLDGDPAALRPTGAGARWPALPGRAV